MFTPSFTCEFCGEVVSAEVEGDAGMFVPCQCKKARDERDRQHYLEMERRKQQRRR